MDNFGDAPHPPVTTRMKNIFLSALVVLCATAIGYLPIEFYVRYHLTAVYLDHNRPILLRNKFTTWSAAIDQTQGLKNTGIQEGILRVRETIETTMIKDERIVFQPESVTPNANVPLHAVDMAF